MTLLGSIILAVIMLAVLVRMAERKGITMELRDQIKTRINFALNSSKKCVGCEYLNDCRWLKESGSWCGGKTEDVATILVAEIYSLLPRKMAARRGKGVS